MISNRQRKKLRKQKMCLNKRTYKSAQRAKEADPLRYPYQCPICYGWHNASTPNMDEVDNIMRKYK